METKKFIWGYLIYNQCVGVPSYWGGIKIPENELTRLNCSYKEVYGKYIEEIRNMVSKHSITFITPTQFPNPNPSHRTSRGFLRPGEIEVVIVDYLSMIR